MTYTHTPKDYSEACWHTTGQSDHGQVWVWGTRRRNRSRHWVLWCRSLRANWYLAGESSRNMCAGWRWPCQQSYSHVHLRQQRSEADRQFKSKDFFKLFQAPKLTYRQYGPDGYALAVDLVRQGRVNLKPLFTHRFPFTECKKAFETTQKETGPDGKMVIKTISKDILFSRRYPFEWRPLTEPTSWWTHRLGMT